MLNIIEEFNRKSDNQHFIYSSNNKISTAEINQQSWSLAQHLKRHTNNIIAFKATSDHFSILYILSIMKAGKTFLPISPDASNEQVRHISKQTNALYLTNGQDNFCSLFNNCFILNNSHLSQKSTPCSFNINNCVYIIFTSGTTGEPKGVCISNDNLNNYCTWALSEFKLSKKDTCLVTTSPAFDLSFTSIFPALISGANICFCQKDHRTGTALLQTIIEHNVTFIKSTPSIIKTIYKMDNFKKCTSLNSLVLGGEKFDLPMAQSIHCILPNCSIYNHYGPTETTIGCCAKKIDFSINGESAYSLKPITNMYGVIVDSNNIPITNNSSGELIVYGKSVGSYLNTKSTSFFEYNNEKAFKTGDICHYAEDGGIVVEGRLNSIVKVKGYRINLNQISAAMKNIKGIKDAVCHFFEQQNKFIGFYTSNDDISLNFIKNELAKVLPTYSIPPILCKCNKISINTNGKIDLNDLYSNYIKSISYNNDQFSKILLEYFTFNNLDSVLDKPIKFLLDSLDTISLICRIEEVYNCSIDISSIETLRDIYNQINSKPKLNTHTINNNTKIESKIVLIGGGENGRPGTNYETEEIDKHIAKLTNKDNPQLLFIGIHSSTPEAYGQLIRMNFNKFNCSTTILSLKDCEDYTKIKKLFLDADIIYIGGGDTEQLKTLATQYKLNELLKLAFNRGCIISGLCSGANYLCKKAVIQIYSDKPTYLNSGYLLEEGLGLAPLTFCPHFDVEPKRAYVARETVKSLNEIIYACENETALIIKPNGEYETLTLKNKKIYKLYNSNNICVEKYLNKKGKVNYEK